MIPTLPDQKTTMELMRNINQQTKSNEFKKQGNQNLLDKNNRFSFQIDNSYHKQSQETEQIHKQSYIQSQQEKCYPKCLSCIGSCFVPFLFCCPCIRCNACCKNIPFFQQPVTNFGLLQRWGSYQKLLNPGLHIINPISQKVIQINRQTKTIQIAQIVFTKDNVQFRVQSVIFYRIVDSLRLAYKLGTTQEQCRQCVAEITQACLRNIVGSNTLQNVIQKRQILGKNLRDDLNSNLKVWGIYIQAANLKQIILSEQIKQYLQSTARTKRMMQAQIVNYQAQVQIGKLIRQMSQILSTKSAFQIRYLDTIGTILQKNPNTVIMMKTQMDDK